MRARILIVAVALLVVFAVGKEREFSMPRASHAKTYPAHDAHPAEKFTIAADPYDTPDKAGTFVVDYRREGLLPILMIFSNDNDGMVLLTDMNVKLVTKKRVRIEPSDPDDIYRRIAKQKRRGDEPPLNLPIPIPRKSPRSISGPAMNEVENMQFMAKAVEPKSTKAGFMVFDVEGIPNPLAGATLQITGVKDQDGNHLFYFEISLDKYLNHQPGEPQP